MPVFIQTIYFAIKGRTPNSKSIFEDFMNHCGLIHFLASFNSVSALSASGYPKFLSLDVSFLLGRFLYLF
jgi:hypothetical protein